MIKYFLFLLIAVVLGAILLLGFRGQRGEGRPFEVFSDMDHQPKYKSQNTSDFYADGRSDRHEIPGTVPFGVPVEDPYYLTGKIKGEFANGFPESVEVTQEFLDRGKERYEINCAVCHGYTGDGKGMTTKYGMVGVASFLDERLVDMPDGQIYYTAAYGKGTMLGYPHIKVDDRWAIVAYIRALQISQTGTAADLPEGFVEASKESNSEEETK